MKLPPTPRLAGFLRRSREQAGMSLQYVADATNEHPVQFTKTGLQRLETGKSPVHSSFLTVLSNIYCVDPALMLEVLELDLYLRETPASKDESELWTAGSAAVLAGNYRQAVAMFDRMIEVATDGELRSKAAVGLATSLPRIGSYRLAEYYAELPLRVGMASTRVQAHALFARARLEQRRRLFVSAEWLAKGAAELAREAGDERVALDAEVLFAASAHMRGDFRVAVDRYVAAGARLDEIGATSDVTTLRIGLALARVRAGEVARGINLHGSTVSATMGNPSRHCYALLAWGESLYRLERYASAEKRLRNALEIARGLENREYSWLAQYYLWRITGNPQTLKALRRLRERISDYTYHPEFDEFDREMS